MLSANTMGLFRISLLVLVCVQFAVAQDQPVPTNAAPPPAKIISTETRELLDRAGDGKSRVKKTIELAETHLSQAEALSSQDKHNEASAELGKYWALIEDVLKHLSPYDTEKTKTRDLYKRLELSLRAHGTRLALMRRTTPLEYAVWIKALEDFARSSRSEALNSFYGHTVMREETPNASGDKPPKDSFDSPRK